MRAPAAHGSGFWLALVAITAVGLALRIAAARGGLWLDEAWSALFARDVATPAGVFLNINHDNNHHLNTLWLQLVGFDAPQMLQRALSIVSGTAAIMIAGVIGARRSRAGGLATALLFAVSPLLVTLGSEARGYAPMMLAFVIAILVTDRWLSNRVVPVPVAALSAVALLGVLSHLTMVFALVAIAGWVMLRVWRESGFAPALGATLRLMAVPLIVAGVTAFAILALISGPAGFQFGAFEPFSLRALWQGLGDMLEQALGLPAGDPVRAVAAIAVLAAITTADRTMRPLYLMAIVALPVSIAITQLGNVAISRYYMVTATTVLLLLGEVAGRAIARGVITRVAALVALGAVLVGGAMWDARIIRNLRADPAATIVVMRRISPLGAMVSVDRPRAAAVIEAAAASAHFPVTIAACGRFLFVDRDGDERFEAAPMRCGMRYREIARGTVIGISGTHWRLYEAAPLP